MTILPVLDFHYHGDIAEGLKQQTRQILEECYERMSAHVLPEKVEVRLCETPLQLAIFLQIEKAELGIHTLGDENITCSYDTWRDFPRILICVERLFNLPLEAQHGIIRHVSAHTVLHGGLVYYVVRIPPDCLEIARDRNIYLELMKQLLYNCAAAVKDFEVTRQLLHAGYRDCQVEFIKTLFSISAEDRLDWYIARLNPQNKMLFFSGQLKKLLAGWPLNASGLLNLENCADSMLDYVEKHEKRQLLCLANSIAAQLGDSTHDNMRLALREVLTEPLF